MEIKVKSIVTMYFTREHVISVLHDIAVYSMELGNMSDMSASLLPWFLIPKLPSCVCDFENGNRNTTV